MNKIFLTEDDKNFGSVLKSYLEIHDYEVTWIEDGGKSVAEFKKSEYDICILDVMLPNSDGFTIAKEIKKLNKAIPIIFLTAKTMKEDILEGYKSGADDYITKPFDSEVLLYKIKAVLNRSSSTKDFGNEVIFNFGDSKFDYSNRQVSFPGYNQKLSPKESELLKLLFEYKNKILPRTTALNQIWGNDDFFTGRSMDVYITKLRKYLRKETASEIINIHGAGYKLQITA